MYAAKKGNLENMKWLKENGCPWNKWTFISAVENGNQENIKWLKENGCLNSIDIMVLVFLKMKLLILQIM